MESIISAEERWVERVTANEGDLTRSSLQPTMGSWETLDEIQILSMSSSSRTREEAGWSSSYITSECLGKFLVFFQTLPDLTGGRPQEAAVYNPSTTTPQVPETSFGSEAPQPFRYWQDEFSESRLNATMGAPAGGAYQNSGPFSHLSIQEIVPSERKVNIQDPQNPDSF